MLKQKHNDMKKIDKVIMRVAQGCAIVMGASLSIASFLQGGFREGLAWLCVALLTATLFSMDAQNDKARRLISELLEMNKNQDTMWAKCVSDLTDKLCDAMAKIADDIKGRVALVDDHVKEIIHDD